MNAAVIKKETIDKRRIQSEIMLWNPRISRDSRTFFSFLLTPYLFRIHSISFSCFHSDPLRISLKSAFLFIFNFRICICICVYESRFVSFDLIEKSVNYCDLIYQKQANYRFMYFLLFSKHFRHLHKL